MSYKGLIGVDWEDRVDFTRMRDERLKKTIASMKKNKVDGLLLFRWENLRYTTGQRYVPVGNSPFEHCASFVALNQDGAPIVFSMDIDDTKSRASWIPEKNLRPHHYVQTASGARGLAGQLKALGLDRGRLGVDLWEPTCLEVLKKELSGTTFVNGQKVMMDARMVKTVDELDCLKIAYSIGESGLQAGLDILKPGVRECEVQAAIWKRALDLGAEWFQSPVIVTSKTTPYRRFTSDNIILEGDSVIIDSGPVFNGYFSDFVRTWYCGKYTRPSQKARDAFRQANDVLQKVIQSMRPGATTGEVFAAAGKWVLGRMLGHGIGLAGQEAPFITEDEVGESVVLEPGMAFSVEPYVQIPGSDVGFRLEEEIIITKDGPIVYSTFPHGPLSEM